VDSRSVLAQSGCERERSVSASVGVRDWPGDWTWSHSARSESVLRPLRRAACWSGTPCSSNCVPNCSLHQCSPESCWDDLFRDRDRGDPEGPRSPRGSRCAGYPRSAQIAPAAATATLPRPLAPPGPHLERPVGHRTNQDGCRRNRRGERLPTERGRGLPSVAPSLALLAYGRCCAVFRACGASRRSGLSPIRRRPCAARTLASPPEEGRRRRGRCSGTITL